MTSSGKAVFPQPPPPPLFARWPFKAVPLLGAFGYIALRIPGWALLWGAFPSTRPNPKLTMPQSILFEVVRIWFCWIVPKLQFFPLRRDTRTVPAHRPRHPTRAVRIPPAPPGLLVGQIGEWLTQGKITAAPIPGYWSGKDRNRADLTARPGERCLLAFHGGGYLEQSAHWSDPIASFYTLAVNRIAAKTPDSLISGLCVEYRTSNETSFPGIVADAISAYAYLVEVCKYEPKNITVAGDSAGAHLTLALTRHLRDTNVLPLPGSLLLISPWTDLSMSSLRNTLSVKANHKIDYLENPAVEAARDRVVRDLPIDSLDSPYLSPGCKEVVQAHPSLYAGFPPALFIAGGKEIWFDAIRDVFADYSSATASIGTDDKSASRRKQLSAFYAEPEFPHDYIAFHALGCRAPTLRTIDRINDFLLATNQHSRLAPGQ